MDPKLFKEAVMDLKWCEAMNLELRALEENGTWKVVEFPLVKKAIGCH